MEPYILIVNGLWNMMTEIILPVHSPIIYLLIMSTWCQCLLVINDAEGGLSFILTNV